MAAMQKLTGEHGWKTQGKHLHSSCFQVSQIDRRKDSRKSTDLINIAVYINCTSNFPSCTLVLISPFPGVFQDTEARRLPDLPLQYVIKKARVSENPSDRLNQPGNKTLPRPHLLADTCSTARNMQRHFLMPLLGDQSWK